MSLQIISGGSFFALCLTFDRERRVQILILLAAMCPEFSSDPVASCVLAGRTAPLGELVFIFFRIDASGELACLAKLRLCRGFAAEKKLRGALLFRGVSKIFGEFPQVLRHVVREFECLFSLSHRGSSAAASKAVHGAWRKVIVFRDVHATREGRPMFLLSFLRKRAANLNIDSFSF
jgi:hypothetical protein